MGVRRCAECGNAGRMEKEAEGVTECSVCRGEADHPGETVESARWWLIKGMYNGPEDIQVGSGQGRVK
jgi:hypothetical protein